MDASSVYQISAGAPVLESIGGGGGLGNRVNAVVLNTVLSSQEAAMKAAIGQAVAQSGVGRILNVTV